jgi:hypothetical protein
MTRRQGVRRRDQGKRRRNKRRNSMKKMLMRLTCKVTYLMTRSIETKTFMQLAGVDILPHIDSRTTTADDPSKIFMKNRPNQINHIIQCSVSMGTWPGEHSRSNAIRTAEWLFHLLLGSQLHYFRLGASRIMQSFLFTEAAGDGTRRKFQLPKLLDWTIPTS